MEDEDYSNEEYEIMDEKISSNDNNVQFFKDESIIIKEREEIINEAIERLGLSEDEAILAMIYLELKKDVIDDWYNNLDENRIKSGLELSEETKEKLKNEGIESNGNICLICSNEKNNSFFALNCGHQFCGECWTEYLKEKIKYPLEALQVKCPQDGCTCIIYESIYRKYLKDNKKSLEKLNKAIYKNFLDHNSSIKHCPNEQCKYLVKSAKHTYTNEIECPCGTYYCFNCLKEAHRPCPCELVDKFMKTPKIKPIELSKEKIEDYNKKWIEANTKECPHCHRKIQKSYGCNYMLCDKKAGGCGKAFCYVCETDWELHTKDHFKCNKYTEQIKQKEENAKKIQNDLNKDLKELERNESYNFYTNRYLMNKDAVDICKTIFKEDLKQKINLIRNEMNYDVTDFIFKVLDTIIKAKRTLKYTYIFGFYMKDTYNKLVFEHSQGLLEYHTENLHKLLLGSNLDSYINSKD